MITKTRYVRPYVTMVESDFIYCRRNRAIFYIQKNYQPGGAPETKLDGLDARSKKRNKIVVNLVNPTRNNEIIRFKNSFHDGKMVTWKRILE